MKNQITIQKTVPILKKLVHFLGVNSEAIRAKGLQGQMSLVYFLFSYGKLYKLQHYMDFAFSILEGQLVEVHSQFQTGKGNSNLDLDLLEVGWSLQKFVKMGFFESDELDDILLPFDKIGVKRIKGLTNGRPSKENLFTLILITSYMQNRVVDMDRDFVYAESIKEALQCSRMLLDNSMDMIRNDQPLLLLVTGLKENTQKGYRTNFELFLSEQQFFEEQTGKNSKDALTNGLEIAMLKMYESESGNFEKTLLDVILGGSMILDNKTDGHQEFIAYALVSQNCREQTNL